MKKIIFSLTFFLLPPLVFADCVDGKQPTMDQILRTFEPKTIQGTSFQAQYSFAKVTKPTCKLKIKTNRNRDQIEFNIASETGDKKGLTLYSDFLCTCDLNERNKSLSCSSARPNEGWSIDINNPHGIVKLSSWGLFHFSWPVPGTTECSIDFKS